MYWTADRTALPEGYEDRVRDWLLNVRYKSAAPEKIEEYLAEASMAALHWTDDWLLLTDTLTANRVSFDATLRIILVRLSGLALAVPLDQLRFDRRHVALDRRLAASYRHPHRQPSLF